MFLPSKVEFLTANTDKKTWFVMQNRKNRMLQEL